MTLTSDQVVRLEAWGVVALAQVDDHPFAWGLVGCVIAELWMLESHDLVHGAPLAVAQVLLDQGL